MRVLFLTTSYPLDEGSSSGIFVERLTQKLAEEHEIGVLTPSDAIPRQRHQRGAITVIPVHYAPCSWQRLAHRPGGIPVALRESRWHYLLLPMLLGSLWLAVAREGSKYDVIHANWAICGVVASLAARFSGKPVVCTVRGEDITRAARNFLDRRILVACLKLCSRVVGVSESLVKTMQGMADESKAPALIENGVDDELLAMERHIASSGVIRMVFIGSLIERKGVTILIDALAKIKQRQDWYLTIVGAGNEQRRLELQVDGYHLQDRVSFTGPVEPQNISGLLSEQDILILPSFSEGRPNVVLEAMAAAMPVIASNIPGVDELISHRHNGLLFPAGDSIALADCLVEVCDDPDLRRGLGNNARATIADAGLTWQATAARYSRLYTEVVKV